MRIFKRPVPPASRGPRDNQVSCTQGRETVVIVELQRVSRRMERETHYVNTTVSPE